MNNAIAWFQTIGWIWLISAGLMVLGFVIFAAWAALREFFTGTQV